MVYNMSKYACMCMKPSQGVAHSVWHNIECHMKMLAIHLGLLLCWPSNSYMPVQFSAPRPRECHCCCPCLCAALCLPAPLLALPLLHLLQQLLPDVTQQPL
jgi:hypothetical protein